MVWKERRNGKGEEEAGEQWNGMFLWQLTTENWKEDWRIGGERKKAGGLEGREAGLENWRGDWRIRGRLEDWRGDWRIGGERSPFGICLDEGHSGE